MTRKKTVIGLLFLIFFIIAIARIGKTIVPALKPSVLNGDTSVVTEQLPEGLFVPIASGTTFLESDLPLEVSVFAKDLTSPRALLFDEAGKLLVSSNKHDTVMRLFDSDSDAVADVYEPLLTNLDRPHGIAFNDGTLYVAEEERVVRYLYDQEEGILGKGQTILELPKGGRHFTRSLAISADDKLYISIGSSCDTCIENDRRLAAVLEANLDGTESRVYAEGLRNAVFIKFRESSGELFGTEMGRDHLGDNLPPDEINIIKEGRGYGWPFCYSKQVYDTVFAGVNNCEFSEPSLIDLPAHVSPLGFAFIPDSWGEDLAGDLLVAYHGSWNSSVPVGYKVERFEKLGKGFAEIGKPFLEGFLDDDGGALGRPVDLVFDSSGTLYMSDDKSGFIYAIRLQQKS